MKNTNNNAQKELRKELRTHGTPAEGRLWLMLKNKQIEGLKFRRQFSVGPFVLDFYCPQKQLAIELDGQPHMSSGGQMRDEQRTEYLKRIGIEVIRFENKLVFEQGDAVRAAIVEAVNLRPDFTPQSLRDSSPKQGSSLKSE